MIEPLRESFLIGAGLFHASEWSMKALDIDRAIDQIVATVNSVIGAKDRRSRHDLRAWEKVFCR